MFVLTVADAHELVHSWRGARPGKSPASWRRDAALRLVNAANDESRGRTESARVEREIAAVFEAAAVEREQEIAARDAAFEAEERAREAASEARIAALRAARGIR